MNIREGMHRRLALVVGVLGAILGGFFAIAVPLNQNQRGIPITWGDILGFSSLPILGFLLPWAAIRALSWVLTGFSKPNQP